MVDSAIRQKLSIYRSTGIIASCELCREFYQRNREMLKQIPITLGGDLLFIGYRKEIKLFRFITRPMIQNMKIALAV